VGYHSHGGHVLHVKFIPRLLHHFRYQGNGFVLARR
jgi:hypothetical protein